MQIIICGCWPRREPLAAKWFSLDCLVAPKRFLTCAYDRSRRDLAKSSMRFEIGALCVELLQKHSKNRNKKT